MKFKINGQKACIKTIAGIRLTQKQHATIEKLALENKISMQEVVRQMVEFCLQDRESEKS